MNNLVPVLGVTARFAQNRTLRGIRATLLRLELYRDELRWNLGDDGLRRAAYRGG